MDAMTDPELIVSMWHVGSLVGLLIALVLLSI